MISYHEALRLILQQQHHLEVELVKTSDSSGRVLAEDLYAPVSLPGYDNSAMDGFALIAEETQSATLDHPVWLQQSACVAAGEILDHTLHVPQSTIEIMTGAPVPHPFNAVIPVEKILKNIQQARPMIGVTYALTPGENIRYQGEDIQQNTFLLAQGEEINPHRIMTLAGLGLRQIPVFKKSRVLVISTGKELVVDQPIDSRYQLYDCNSPFLQSALLNTHQCEVVSEHLGTDTDEAFMALVNSYLLPKNGPDIIISTGAVSAGKYDFIPRSLEKMGARIIFHKVAVRPGKPVLFAILPNGAFYFGLPGNPAAVAAGFRFFVSPLLRHINKMERETPVFAKLKETNDFKVPLCFFQKAHHYIDETGCSYVSILPGQASFMISPMIKPMHGH